MNPAPLRLLKAINTLTVLCTPRHLPLGAGRFIPLTMTTTISVLLSSGNILRGRTTVLSEVFYSSYTCISGGSRRFNINWGGVNRTKCPSLHRRLKQCSRGLHRTGSVACDVGGRLVGAVLPDGVKRPLLEVMFRRRQASGLSQLQDLQTLLATLRHLLKPTACAWTHTHSQSFICFYHHAFHSVF